MPGAVPGFVGSFDRTRSEGCERQGTNEHTPRHQGHVIKPREYVLYIKIDIAF